MNAKQQIEIKSFIERMNSATTKDGAKLVLMDASKFYDKCSQKRQATKELGDALNTLTDMFRSKY